jgi:type IV pilus assembly protein PilM
MGTVKFYKDEPLFGLDIGHSSLKAMQIHKDDGGQPAVLGYGMSDFEPAAVQNGVIIKPEALANAIHELFEKKLTGSISSKRVACCLPTSHTFSRPMKVPPMTHEEILEAIHLEAEQYIPIPIDNLYLDYEISHQDEQGVELTLVAASRKIVDSYLTLLQSLQLEPVAFEPSINAASRLLNFAGSLDSQPSILVDIGSVTTDIAVYDKKLLVSSTHNEGGDTITALLAKNMHLTPEQAIELKSSFGLVFSEKQQRIIDSLKPLLENLIHEIQKSIRYYAERAAQSNKNISQIITVGGGASMPGLNQYLSKEMRLPTVSLDPWQKINFGSLQAPGAASLSEYLTVAGEAILEPAEITT